MSYSSRRGSGPPAWFVFLLGMAFVFGLYYLYAGVRDFMESGGVPPLDPTQEIVVGATRTAERRLDVQADLPTRRPTSTPIPPCQDFAVSVSSAVIRSGPTTSSEFIDNRAEGEIVCVIGLEAGTNWYLIDLEPATRFIDRAYMREDLLRPLNPTATPTPSPPPPPTITLTPTWTPTETPTITPTPASDEAGASEGGFPAATQRPRSPNAPPLDGA